MPGPTQGRLNLNPRWPFWDTSKFAAAVDAAAAPQVYDKTGFATVGLVAAGDAASEFAETGFATVGTVGSGAKVFTPWVPLTAGFEQGTLGATIFNSDPGDADAWDTVQIPASGSATYASGPHAHGTLGGKLVTAGTVGNMQLGWINAKVTGVGANHYGRFYIWLPANPASLVDIFTVLSGATIVARIFLRSDGKISITDSTGAGKGTSTNALNLNQKCRLEYHIIHSATVGQIEVKIFNDPDSVTPTETLTSAATLNTFAGMSTVYHGAFSGLTNFTVTYDSIVAAATSYPGPDTTPKTSIRAGFASAGLVGSGADVDMAAEAGVALVGTVGAGVSAFTAAGGAVYTKTGFATAGLVGSGGSVSVYTKAGFAAAGLVAAGVRAVDHIRTGFATAGLVGSGPSASVFAKAGFATVGGVGSGADADFTQETGFAVAGLVGSGASSSVFTRTGLSVVGLVASGPSASVFVEAGNGSVNTIGAAPSESLTQETGAGVVGTVGAGFVTRAGETVKTGAGACGLVGAGTSASVFARLGNAIAGTVGSGPSESIYQETGAGLDAATVFLLHANGPDGSTVFTDAIGHPLTTVGNAQIDTAQSEFGGGSLLLDGTGDKLTTPDSADWAFGSGDFTVDFWARFNNVLAGRHFLGQYDAGGAQRSWGLYMQSGTVLSFRGASTATDSTQYTFPWAPTTGQWYHIAIVRRGNTLYAFVDGTQLGTNLIAVALFDSSADLTIGGITDAGLEFNGWLDEVRISKGVARWTVNFTPPTAPYGPVAVGTVGSGVASRSATAIKTGFATVSGLGSGSSASLFARAGRAIVGLFGAGVEVTTRASFDKTGAGVAGTTARGSSASIFDRTGSASAALTARGAKAVVYVQGGYAILTGTGSAVRVRQIQKTGVGFLGVSGYGDNTEHFDPERPGHIVGSHTGQPNHSTTGHQTASIATILATGRNGRLTRSKTGELV